MWTCICSVAVAAVKQRKRTCLAVLVQAAGLKRALTPYTLAGPYGRLLDADGEMFGPSAAQAFETAGLVGTPAAPAVLAYLFYRIGRRLDGRPSLIMIDDRSEEHTSELRSLMLISHPGFCLNKQQNARIRQLAS